MHAIGIAEQGEVDVVVDHKKGAGVASELTQSSSQCQEVAPAEGLVAELEDLGATAQGGERHGLHAVGVVVGGDDVEVGGEEAV